jgi:hypothetical protein
MNGVSPNHSLLNKSELLSEMPRGLYDRLHSKSLFYFNHKFGIKYDTYKSKNKNNIFKRNQIDQSKFFSPFNQHRYRWKRFRDDG